MVIHGECEPVLHVPCAVAIDGRHDLRGRVLSIAYMDVVNGGVVHVQHIVQPLSIHSIRSPQSPFIVACQSSIQVQCPRFCPFFGDDVDDTTPCIASIKCRCSTFHNLDALHICHVQTGEIHVVHRLASQPLSIHKEENALTAKSTQVHVLQLVHGIREFYTWHLLLKQVFHVGGIHLLNVGGGDDTGLDGCILQQFRGACACHHHIVEQESGVLLLSMSEVRKNEQMKK